MWSALENMALRESLPAPLRAGESIHDILISTQYPLRRHNLCYAGQRRSRRYLLKQYYSLDTDAFLRRQNEARFINVGEVEGFRWPVEEWRGGVISPYPEGVSMQAWLTAENISMQRRVEVGANLALHIARLHEAGIAHRALSPTSVFISDNGVEVSNFGSAIAQQWDDLWGDSIFRAQDVCCASPQMLTGKENPYVGDVFAFGTLLYRLLCSNEPFAFLRRMMRQIVPSRIPPAPLPDCAGVPPRVLELLEATLALQPESRPTMREAVSILGDHAPLPANLQRFVVPNDCPGNCANNKVMVFVKDDDRAVSLFDAAIRTAEIQPSMFLFVGLTPSNLPSGHEQRFKGAMFRKLSQGLMRCRSTRLVWGLRVLENVVPEKAAQALIEQYRPDKVFIGKQVSKIRWERSFEYQTSQTGAPILTF